MGQVFSCEFSEILNTFFIEHLQWLILKGNKKVPLTWMLMLPLNKFGSVIYFVIINFDYMLG